MTRKRRIALLVLAAGVLALAVLPAFTDGEHIEIDRARRAELQADGHAFADLDAGFVHYELAGPKPAEDAPLVVLIHGVSGPMEVWDPTVRALARAGLPSLRFDHYGRGWSQRVERDYELDLFAGTVEALLAALELDDAPLVLVGSSMGAIVAAEYALRHPERVRRAVLIGPAGFPLEANPMAKLIRVPLVGDYLMSAFGDRTLAAHNRGYFYAPEAFAPFQARFEQQLAVVGSKAAILSTMRHTPVQDYVARYRAFGALGLPTLLIWGRADATFPFHHHTTALEAIPQAAFVGVDRAGHLPMLERPDEVVPRVVSFARP